MAGVVSYDGSWEERKLGFIDKSGNVVIPLIYNHMRFYNDHDDCYQDFTHFSEGLAVVYDYENTCKYLSKTGEVVITIDNNGNNVRGGNFYNGLARVHMCRAESGDCKDVHIDNTGNIAIPLEFIER